MLWQNTLIYAGSGGGGGQIQSALAPIGDDRLSGFRMGGM